CARTTPYVEQDPFWRAPEPQHHGPAPPPSGNPYPSFPAANNWYPWDRNGRFTALGTPLSVYRCAADSRQDLATLVPGNPGQPPSLKVAFTGYLGISGPDFYAWSKAPSLSYYKVESPGILVSTNKFDPSIGNREVPVSSHGVP